MKREDDLKLSLERNLDSISVPDSLYRFAEELPERFERGELQNSTKPASMKSQSLGFRPILFKVAVAAALMVFTFSAAVKMSPVFAAFVRGVPGIEVAIDWLRHIRELDGVQTAVNHGYTPIEPATLEIDGTKITISDIYLTDEELLFKSFIQTDEFDITDRSGTVHMFVAPENLRGGGSTTASSIVTTADGSNKPVLQETYKYQLEDGAAKKFLAKGEELILVLKQLNVNHETRDMELVEKGKIAVPIQRDKLLQNKVFEPKQSLTLEDQEWKELTLEKLTIQPTTMNVIMSGVKGWDYDFPREEAMAPYIKDDKGNVYRYDPSGPVLLLEEGKQQLPFSSSVFFDPDVRTLYLHIGEITVRERHPSVQFDLSTNDAFPKTIRFKDRDIVIEGAEYYSEGYIRLKVKRENPDQTSLKGVDFGIVEQADRTDYNEFSRKQSDLREALNISGFGSAVAFNNMPYLSVFLPAPELERYTITLSRANDKIMVNKDIPIELNR